MLSPKLKLKAQESAKELQNTPVPIELFDYAPYSYTFDGQIKGIFPAILKRVFDEVGVQTKFKIAPAARIKFKFLNNELAIWPAELASIKDHIKREDVIMYNVLTAYASFSSLKENNLPRPSLDNIKGKKIAFIRGFKKEFEVYQARGAILLEASNFDQLMQMLTKKRADYIGIAEIAAYYYAKKLEITELIKIHPHIFSFPVGIIFNKKNKELADKFHLGFKKLVESGEYKKIILENTKRFHPKSEKLLIKEYSLINNDIGEEVITLSTQP